MEKDIKPAEFIADLYECRAKMIRPASYRELQDPQEVLQYNWLNVIIAKLTDKYKVENEDIAQVFHLRTIHKTPEERDLSALCGDNSPTYTGEQVKTTAEQVIVALSNLSDEQLRGEARTTATQAIAYYQDEQREKRHLHELQKAKEQGMKQERKRIRGIVDEIMSNGKIAYNKEMDILKEALSNKQP